MPRVPANRAPVRPRVRVQPGGLARLLEEEIAELLAKPEPAMVWLVGPPGSGKSTALAHLAAVFASEARLRLWDDEPFVPGADTIDIKAVSAPTPLPPQSGSTVWTMASWCDDDCLEYLHHVHPLRIAGAFAAWRATPDEHDLLRWPGLCAQVLDELAGEDSPADALQALRCLVSRMVQGCEEAAMSLATSAFLRGELVAGDARVGVPTAARHALRSHTAEALLAARRLLDLAVAARPFALDRLLWDRALAVAAMVVLSQEPDRRARLSDLVSGGGPGDLRLGLSLLSVTQERFRPGCEHLQHLAHALLAYADLHGLTLAGDCDHVHLAYANLRSACMNGCRLDWAVLTGADLEGSWLRKASCFAVQAGGLRARGVDACDAYLRDAMLHGASLQAAILRGADLRGAVLGQADLTAADLTRARLARADLTTTNLAQANLTQANLHGVRAAGVIWPKLVADHADWSAADLTGSRLHGAQLSHGTFRRCGLGHVDWQGADLRGADFTGATFHLGNARSGLVDSTIASEGSRTGFYTDESLEEQWRQPESVRKANLQNCDLRGARLQGVDLYLVDLRGARLDPRDRDWARRCRALLDTEESA